MAAQEAALRGPLIAEARVWAGRLRAIAEALVSCPSGAVEKAWDEAGLPALAEIKEATSSLERRIAQSVRREVFYASACNNDLTKAEDVHAKLKQAAAPTCGVCLGAHVERAAEREQILVELRAQKAASKAELFAAVAAVNTFYW
jgi:hypothetical protein